MLRRGPKLSDLTQAAMQAARRRSLRLENVHKVAL